MHKSAAIVVSRGAARTMATLLFLLELLLFSSTLILSMKVCDSKSIVVVPKYIDADSALQSFAVCNSCGPGFEASETCLAGLKSNSHAIILKSKVNAFFGDDALEVSQCRPCHEFHYSDTHGINKTCKACSFCDPNEEIIMPCTPTADAVCGTSHGFNATIATRRRSMKPTVWNIHLASYKTIPEARTSIPQELTPNTRAHRERSSANHAISNLSVILISALLAFAIVNLLFLCHMIKRRKEMQTSHAHSLKDISNTERMIPPIDHVEVTSWEVANTYTSCGDFRVKSNMSSPEPTSSQQFFSSDPIVTETIPVLHRLNLEDNVPMPDNAECRPDDIYDKIPKTSDDQCTCEPRTCSLDSGVASCYRPRARSTNSTLSRFGSTDTDIDETCRITLVATNIFGYEGGELKIEDSSVSLRVPKGAISRGETKEIQAKVHVCRPHDWKELRESGYSIGLPQVELGPDGSTFLKPIEVIFENSPSDVPVDTVFEFAEGANDGNASFQEAIRASSRKEAKQAAMKVSPHVAFFAGENNLHAFYMHFTLGRKKAKLKEKVLKATVFMKVDDFIGRTLKLIVAFYEPNAEGELILKNRMTGMKEVSVTRKAITIKANDGNVKTAIRILGEKWAVGPGEDIQECPVETIFDPKYVGILPVIDYIFEATEADFNSFRCTIDVIQKESRKTDLKIGMDKEYLQSIAQDISINLSMSSGYQSSGESHVVEHIIEDSEFAKLEQRAYIQQVCLRLKDHVGAHYKDFSRNLGILDCVIDNMTHDHNGATEICYQLMMHWLNGQENVPDFKASMLAKLRKALDKTGLPCRIILPDSNKAVMVERETTV